MKCVSFLSLFLLCSTILWGQEAVVQTLNPQKCPNVNIKVPHQLIQHEAWDDGGIRVDIVIKSDLPQEVLEALQKANRYALEGKKEAEHYYIKAPNMDIPLLVNGAKIKEKISIKISTPEYISMNDEAMLFKDIDESAILARSDTREEIEAILKKMKEIREDVNVHLKVQSISKVKDVDLTNFMFTLKGTEVAANQISFPTF